MNNFYMMINYFKKLNQLSLEAKSKGTFLLKYLNEIEPLRYMDMQKLLKKLKKDTISNEYRLSNYNFKMFSKSYVGGYWCTNLSLFRYNELIKKDSNNLYRITKKGLKYIDNPFSKFIPPKNHNEESWRKHLKQVDAEQKKQWNEIAGLTTLINVKSAEQNYHNKLKEQKSSVSEKDCLEALDYFWQIGFKDELSSDRKHYFNILFRKVATDYNIVFD